MGSFEGKVALVTGGASGIGRATAERLAAEGARVVSADVDEAGGRAVAESLGVDFEPLDVSEPGAWSGVVERTVSKHGGLDIAFLNAGVMTHPPRSDASNPEELITAFDIASTSDAAIRRILGVNIDGVVFGTRAVVPALRTRGGGAIVATASVAGLIGFPPDPLYTLTKHAVVGFTRALAPTLVPDAISFNCICPGGVDTNILGPRMGEVMRGHGGPIMQPAQIADAVIHAVASGATGESFVCLIGKPHQKHEFAPVG